MNTPSKGGDEAAPTPDAPREQAERTRDALGVTVEALVAKADAKTQVKEEDAKEQVKEEAAESEERAAGEAVAVTERTPGPVREKAGSAVPVAQAKRAPLLAAGAAFVLLFLRCGPRRR